MQSRLRHEGRRRLEEEYANQLPSEGEFEIPRGVQAIPSPLDATEDDLSAFYK